MTRVGGPETVPVTRLIGSALFATAWPALLLLLGGDAHWIEGWLFTAWFVSLYAIVTGWMYFKDPALLAERRRRVGRDASGAERQDRSLLLFLFLGFIGWVALIPLDARRFGWTPSFTPAAKASGGALLLLSAFLLFRSFHDNTFLSGVTRVQSDRTHRVISAGVYRLVRHPMYLGMVLMFAGTPLLLGSRIGLVLAGALTALLVIRIIREERLLARELAGYDEYRGRVRYRLLPWIW
jgi:protein-S-isoprenylcysteine O-methyltransferase Ste14